MGKQFGVWPYITHGIVLTFKEIKHLSDYRTVGPSDRRTGGLSDCRTIGLSDYSYGPPDGMIHTLIDSQLQSMAWEPMACGTSQYADKV